MKEGELQVAPKQSSVQRKVFLKIGRPGYRVTKVRDRDSGKEGMMVQIHLPQIKAGVIPRRRFMSAWEQRREPPNKSYQYLIVRTNTYLNILLCEAYACFSGRGRWQQSRTRLSRSAFPRARLKMSLTMMATGIGHTGTQTRSSTASSLCSVKLSDYYFSVSLTSCHATITPHWVDHNEFSRET
jgi:Pre-mRNA-splicing factor SF3a complex subunit 2 (Prp11)